MGEYVAQCQALPFFGMTIFSLLEWRVKESSKKRAADQTNTRTISKSAPTEEAAAFVDDGASQFKGKGKTKIKYEKVPMCLGITRDCSLIKIDERNEIEMAWRITQIKAYSLLLRDGREQQKLSRLTPNDFILSLDFGECFPHQIQLINRQPKGLLSKSPRHKLRDNAIIHLADDAEDSIRLIFTQIHSYIQEVVPSLFFPRPPPYHHRHHQYRLRAWYKRSAGGCKSVLLVMAFKNGMSSGMATVSCELSRISSSKPRTGMWRFLSSFTFAFVFFFFFAARLQAYRVTTSLATGA